jgi:hypothetical protein
VRNETRSLTKTVQDVDGGNASDPLCGVTMARYHAGPTPSSKSGQVCVRTLSPTDTSAAAPIDVVASLEPSQL